MHSFTFYFFHHTNQGTDQMGQRKVVEKIKAGLFYKAKHENLMQHVSAHHLKLKEYDTTAALPRHGQLSEMTACSKRALLR